MKPHKHAELIKAWADNPSIKFEIATWNIDEQTGKTEPIWKEISIVGIATTQDSDNSQYRIKPEPKPDIVVSYFVNAIGWVKYPSPLDINMTANMKLTFDGETGELKSAEVLK